MSGEEPAGGAGSGKRRGPLLQEHRGQPLMRCQRQGWRSAGGRHTEYRGQHCCVVRPKACSNGSRLGAVDGGRLGGHGAGRGGSETGFVEEEA